MPDRDTLKRFGEQLRRRRLELGLSQEDVAAQAGLHRTYVGSVERGERNVSLLNLFRLSRAVARTPSDLLKDVEE
jgi:transcriptional regulator with XRE-family HTH domain